MAELKDKLKNRRGRLFNSRFDVSRDLELLGGGGPEEPAPTFTSPAAESPTPETQKPKATTPQTPAPTPQIPAEEEIGMPTVRGINISKYSKPLDLSDIDKAEAITRARLSQLPQAETAEARSARQAAWSRLRRGARDAMKKRESQIGWLQVAEQLSNAMVKYAAARRGLDEGVDLSGVEMSKTDWDNKLNQTLDSYADVLESLNRGEAAEGERLDQEAKDRDRLSRRLEEFQMKRGDVRRGEQDFLRRAGIAEDVRVARQQFDVDMKRAANKADERKAKIAHARRMEEIMAKGKVQSEKKSAKDDPRKKERQALLAMDNLDADLDMTDSQRFTMIKQAKSNVLEVYGPEVSKKFNTLVNDEDYDEAKTLLEEQRKPVASGFVTLEAPNGERATVPADKVQFYLDKGAKIIEGGSN